MHVLCGCALVSGSSANYAAVACAVCAGHGAETSCSNAAAVSFGTLRRMAAIAFFIDVTWSPLGPIYTKRGRLPEWPSSCYFQPKSARRPLWVRRR